MKFLFGIIIGVIISALVTLVGTFIVRDTIIQHRTDAESITIADTSVNDSSYMWLDTSNAEQYNIESDTMTIYSYHTNGMASLIKYHHHVLYQNSYGVPMAIRQNDTWLCIGWVTHKSNIPLHELLLAWEQIAKRRMLISKNPVACTIFN